MNLAPGVASGRLSGRRRAREHAQHNDTTTGRLMLSAGYRQFKYKRTDGSGDDEIVQSVTVVGPSIGLSLGIL